MKKYTIAQKNVGIIVYQVENDTLINIFVILNDLYIYINIQNKIDIALEQHLSWTVPKKKEGGKSPSRINSCLSFASSQIFSGKRN